MTTTGRQLFTTLEADGRLTVAIEDVTFPDPTGNQVLVKMEAAPINPSDLAILVSGADMENAEYSPASSSPPCPMPLPPRHTPGMALNFLPATKGRERLLRQAKEMRPRR